jgi:mRNA interferase HigB
VRVISHKAIVQYSRRHPDAAASLDIWYRVTRRADWGAFADVQAVFPNTDRVGGKWVFNIAHNRYRLIADINFRYRCVFIRDILTHAEYDRGGWQS